MSPIQPKPRLLDLFSGAGGCTKGYQQAGFFVIGVDINPQPNYCGDDMIRGDALEVLQEVWLEFDVIHASPPCPRYSTVTPTNTRASHPDLIAEVRRLLRASGKPYVIENVVGAPLENPVRLCGSSFGLDLRRHRLFETNFPLLVPQCDHGRQTPRFQSLDGRMVAKGKLASVIGVHGNCNYAGEFPLRCKAMGIHWMTNDELTQAIPPVYTELIGRQLIDHLSETRTSPPTPDKDVVEQQTTR